MGLVTTSDQCDRTDLVNYTKNLLIKSIVTVKTIQALFYIKIMQSCPLCALW